MPVLKAGLGSVGSAVGAGFTGLCCLGAPAALGIVSAMGLGFVINDLILLPLLAVLLFVALWGLRRSARSHGRQGPERLGYAGAVALVLGVAVGWAPSAYAGVSGLIAASVWNLAVTTGIQQGAGPAVSRRT